MLQLTLDDYMGWPWVPVPEQLPEGDYRVTVPPLVDFELFAATKEEALADWRDALRAHLTAYLAADKVVPMPPQFRLPEVPEVETSTGTVAHVVVVTEGLTIRSIGELAGT